MFKSLAKYMFVTFSFVFIVAFFVVINSSSENTYLVKNNVQSKILMNDYLNAFNKQNSFNKMNINNTSCISYKTAYSNLQKNSEEQVIPASTQKIMTGLMTLKLLADTKENNEDVSLKTKVYYSQISKSLLIKGGYDPLIFSDDYLQILEKNERLVDIQHTSIENFVEQLKPKIENLQINDIFYTPSKTFNRESWTSAETSFVGLTKSLSVNQGINSLPTGKISLDPSFDFIEKVSNDLNLNLAIKEYSQFEPSQDYDQILEMQSLPIKNLLAEMLIQSDNYTAEMMLDYALNKSDISTVQEIYDKYEINVGGKSVDGSGLSPQNKTTCNSLLNSLNELNIAMADNPDQYLSVSGINGTLIHRYNEKYHVDLTGKIIAKTGSIKNVSSLAGYLLDSDDSSDQTINSFSIIINDQTAVDKVNLLIDCILEYTSFENKIQELRQSNKTK